MNLTSGLERWDPYSLWGVVVFGLLLGSSLMVRGWRRRAPELRRGTA